MHNWKPNDLALMTVPTSTRRRWVEVISRPIPEVNQELVDAFKQDILNGAWGKQVDNFEYQRARMEQIPNTRPTIMVRMVPGDPTTLREVPLDVLEPLTKSVGSPRAWRYVHVVNVVGLGHFPEDMLRYDNAALLDPDQAEVDYRPTGPVLVYRVTRYKDWHGAFTRARWASFGYGVVHVKTFDLRAEPFTDAMPSAAYLASVNAGTFGY